MFVETLIIVVYQLTAEMRHSELFIVSPPNIDTSYDRWEDIVIQLLKSPTHTM